MKISLKWLKDYVAISLDPQKLAHKLTMAGLEVEKIETVGTDTVFELEITPNRPDCLNHLGLAREVSAILNKPLKTPKVKSLKIPRKKTDITIGDKNDCARYIGTVIENVSVGASPSWIKERLGAIGLRSVNNIVDITNFCLMETGQPLHAFDYDKLIGGKIVVRRAKEGEVITTIDGVERKLNPSILVIADVKRAVAIAGIMGGKDTEVTGSTKNILLESAYFDPILIRRGARALGLTSDSSYRFERGVDMTTVQQASLRAITLICEHAKGAVSAAADIYPKKVTVSAKSIDITKHQVETMLGAAIPLSKCKSILEKLGFKVSAKKDSLKVSAPSFRGDIRREVDLLEEIARVIGYDNLPTSLPEIKASGIPENKNRILRERLANSFAALGFNEAINFATINKKSLERTKLESLTALKIKNPLTAEQELMRPSLFPSLLSLTATNINKGQKDLRFFEVGKIYPAAGTGERETLGVVLTGRRHHDWRSLEKTDIDFYDMKGAIESALAKIGVENAVFSPAQKDFLKNGQCATIAIDGQEIGLLGSVAGDVLAAWDIKQKNIWCAEINLETLFKHAKSKTKYEPLGEFPSITRDISLAVKKDVSFEAIRKCAFETIPQFLVAVKFVEEYLGDKIPAGHRGMTISLVYQSSSRTLREDEINQLHDGFSKALLQRFNAAIR